MDVIILPYLVEMPLLEWSIADDIGGGKIIRNKTSSINPALLSFPVSGHIVLVIELLLVL